MKGLLTIAATIAAGYLVYRVWQSKATIGG